LLWKIPNGLEYHRNGLENTLENSKIVEIALGNFQIVVKLVRKYQNGLELITTL
jgi:hypothetical protein